MSLGVVGLSVRRIIGVFFVIFFAWSCDDLGVNPEFSATTILPAVLDLPAGLSAATDTLSSSTVWFDTAAVAAEVRGAGEQGYEWDSSFVTRIALRSLDSSWFLGNLARVAVLLGGDTIAVSDVDDVTGRELILPKSAFRPAAFDLPAKPGDSVQIALGYVLRSATTAAQRIAVDVSVESVQSAKFQ